MNDKYEKPENPLAEKIDRRSYAPPRIITEETVVQDVLASVPAEGQPPHLC